MVGTDCGCDVNLFSRYVQQVHFILVRNVLLSQTSCGPRSSSACTYASFWIFPIYKCCKTDAQMWQNIIMHNYIHAVVCSETSSRIYRSVKYSCYKLPLSVYASKREDQPIITTTHTFIENCCCCLEGMIACRLCAHG